MHKTAAEVVARSKEFGNLLKPIRDYYEAEVIPELFDKMMDTATELEMHDLMG